MLFFFSLSIFLSCSDQESSDQDSNIGDRAKTLSTTKNSKNNNNRQHKNNQKTKGSGGALQDPSGFPAFHDWPSPKGPKITPKGRFSSPEKLTQKPAGGYRPQIAIGKDDVMHAIFYMRMNDDGKTVRAMDILFPGIGEIVGGSQREDRIEILKRRMEEMGVEQEELWWYLETRQFGSCPHSGFGLGFERLIMFVTGMKNVRDVIPFPRYPQNAEF